MKIGSGLAAPMTARFGALTLCQKRFFENYPHADTYLNASKRAMGRTLQKQLDWQPGFFRRTPPLAKQINDKLDAMNLDVQIVPDGGDMAGGPIQDTYLLALGKKGTLQNPDYDSWTGNTVAAAYVETNDPANLLLEVPFAVAKHFQERSRRTATV